MASPRDGDGQQQRLADLFRMVRAGAYGTRTAVCEAWTHKEGTELKLVVDGGIGLQMFTVCRSDAEIAGVVRLWDVRMREKGWT
jgi:hypothetical protein